jgi:two-component SAPR family response regulator
MVKKITKLQERFNRNPSDYEALKELGVIYHDMALKDTKTYAKKAVNSLEEAQKVKPEDNVTLCYLGSAYTLMAKESWNPVSKSNYVNKGIECMDKAIKKDPDNITIRMTRGMNSRGLPGFLNRRQVAFEDFEHLADQFEKGLKVPASLKSTVYKNLSGLYKEDGDKIKTQKYQAMAENL